MAQQPFTDSPYTPKAIEAQTEQIYARCIATGLTLGFVVLISALTFACAQNGSLNRAKQASEAQQKIECAKAGSNWMPVQTIVHDGSYDEYAIEMSCVTPQALPGILQQNARVIAQKLN